MRWKNLIIFSVIIIFSWNICFAEEPIKQIEKRVELLKSGLNLSEEQTNVLRKILSDTIHQQSDSSQQNKNLTFSYKQDEDNRRNTINQQIESILNDEQILKFRKMQTSMNGKDDAELLMLKENLSLTNGQLQSIEIIVMSNRQKIEDMKQDNEKNPREYERSMKKIMREQALEIEKLLTPQQIKEFRKLRKMKEKEMHKKRPKN